MTNDHMKTVIHYLQHKQDGLVSNIEILQTFAIKTPSISYLSNCPRGCLIDSNKRHLLPTPRNDACGERLQSTICDNDDMMKGAC